MIVQCRDRLSVGAALALVAACPAAAQTGATALSTASSPSPAGGSPDVATAEGDIIVTAQKRPERLQKVPAAVSVISGDTIAAKGSVSLESAQYLIPTLNFHKDGSTINQTLYLRGVGTSTVSLAGEPSVSTVVDGVVYSRAGEAFSDLIDIDRIEVLRGPQGTLFGKNASAGVVNIVTKRPGPVFAGYVEGGYYTNGNEERVRGAVDIPLSSQLRARLTGFYGTYDGNIRNLAAGGDRVNGYRHYGTRGMVVFEPSADLTLTLIGDYRKANDNCCAWIVATNPADASASLVPTPRGDATRIINQNRITRTLEESYGGSVQADWRLGTQTVTYIGAYRHYQNTEIEDSDRLPAAYVGLNQNHDGGPVNSRTISHELRLTSPAAQFLSYVLGAYYSDNRSTQTFSRSVIQCSSAAVTTVLVPCSTPGVIVSNPSGTATFGATARNFSLFGQGTMNLTGRVRLIGGARFSSDELSVYHQRVTALAGPGVRASFGPFAGKTTNTDWSGKAGVQYDLLAKSVAYVSYAKGYKGPAFNLFFNLNQNGTNVIAPETSDSYEAGIKNTLLDGKLTVNLAGFYAKYHNFQANNPDLVAGFVVTRFTNAGEVSTRGVEADVALRPMSDLTFSGGFAYTDAHIDHFRVPDNGDTSGVVPDGTPLPYAPRLKGSLSADYRIRTGGRLDVQLGAIGSYQSSESAELDSAAADRAGTTIHRYGLLDLSVGIIDSRDRFRLTLSVKNLFDTHFASAIATGGPGDALIAIIPRDADRYFGIVGRVGF